MPVNPTYNRPTLTPGRTPPSKPTLNMSSDSPNPSQWLNFSLPPRQRHVPGSGGPVIPRRSRKGYGGGALSRERFVHANFRFVLKPTETLSYGAHFADPDIAVHWPHILQVLVPTFSAFSVAQGYVSSDHPTDEELGHSLDEHELEEMGEEAAERRRRVEEERRGRNCPICLGKPVAGRMTKCGHVFCFPCILHYIQLSDIPKSAKCPICGDTVHEGMLKSVKYLDATAMLSSAGGIGDEEGDVILKRVEEHDDLVTGTMDGFDEPPIQQAERSKTDEHQSSHRIHMRLIQRPQMTTMALPSSSTWPSDAIPAHTVPWHFLPDTLSFSRFMLATPEYMLSELERELKELRGEWDMLRGDDLGRGFVKSAKDKVERQVGKVKDELMTEMVRKGEMESREAWGDAVGGERKERERRLERERRALERQAATQSQDIIDGAAILDASAPAFNPNVHIPPNIRVEPDPMPTPSPKKSRRRNNPTTPQPASTPPTPSYYFYQSSLGTHVYLHPLDIRILLAHYKSYSLFPSTLSFTSSGFDPGTINDELRKRCKYLSHLPSGTEVVFVEADLEELVGQDGLTAFEQPLKARKAKRRERVKREDRAKVKWEKAEREKNPVFTPTGSREDNEFALALARSTTEQIWDQPIQPHLQPGSAGSSTALSTSPTWVTNQQQQQQRASFATALHTHVAPTTPLRRQDAERDWEVDVAWEAFDRLSVGNRSRDDDGEVRSTGTEKESESGGGGGGGRGKKGRKGQKLVLGGGGGRRA